MRSQFDRERLLEEAHEFGEKLDSSTSPTEHLDPRNPVTFISVGGGELGDLVVTAAKRIIGGVGGGVKTVVFDRYHGFPAQDSADYSEVFDLIDGDSLRKAIKKYVPDPSAPHVIFLEIERAATYTTFELGVKENFNVASTPYAPLIFMDRYLTKLLFDKLNLPSVNWRYAKSAEELKEAAEEIGLPVIVKPIMTSSGHGTTIVRERSGLEEAYEHSVKHARGKGDEVIVEEYLEELKEEGTEITQLVLRHFDESGRIVSTPLPPVEHKRPGATYHESWMPAKIPEEVARKCMEYAVKIADYIGGLGLFAVEQFVLRGKVYNSEVANRPHDTGMITRWMLMFDEGALQLLSTIGLPIPRDWVRIVRNDVFGAAHVILAPKLRGKSVRVKRWSAKEVISYGCSKGYSFDLWYFGKPVAYPGRRMGLAVAFHEELSEARRIAEEVAHLAEKSIEYEESL